MNVTDFFLPLHSPKLARVEIASEHGMHSWLSNTPFVPSKNDGELIISHFSLDQLLRCWASDTSRLLAAARDTLLAISLVEDRPQSTAWSLVKVYYAAFYYAHVVLRLTRTSLTYTPTSSLLNLRSLAYAYSVDPPFKFTTNQYILSFSEVSPKLVLTQKSGGDGTHQNTWAETLKLLARCTQINELKSFGDADKAEYTALSDLIVKVITQAGVAGNSLSEFRNGVQYRHQFGVWPPYGSTLRGDYCRRKVGELRSGKTDVGSFDVSNRDPAVSFFNSCLLFCWIVEKFVERVSSSSTKCFLLSKTLNW